MTTDPSSAARNRTGVAGGTHARAGQAEPRGFDVRGWLLWTVAFLGFPLAGIAAEAAVGRIDDAVSALVGGLVAGATGAITFMALSGALLYWLRAATTAAGVPPAG